MVTDYKVVTSSELNQLEAYVNGYIREGWEPQGSIFVKRGPIFDTYMQAMVLEKNDGE